MDRLYDYAMDRHGREFEKYENECPYSIEGLGDEFAWKQRFSWFLSEKVLPSTGKTVLEEFIEKYVAPDEPALAKRMLQMKEVIRGSFRVLDDRYLPYVTVEHLETGNRYVAVSRVDPSKRFFKTGDVINSRIRPWGDRFYMFEGILTRSEREEDVARRLGLVSPEFVMEWFEKREIRKLESGDVEEVLRAKLPERSIEALRLLFSRGWIVKYGVLAKRFSDEVSLWWNEEPPNSDIGLLRLHGLVVVGRMPSPTRLYKVAVVPVEARAQIERFFTPSEQDCGCVFASCHVSR